MTTPTTLPAPPSPAPAEAVARTASIPRSYVRRPNSKFERDLSPRDIAASLSQPDTVLWVNIDSSNRHQLALLEKIFKFHQLAIEDTLNPNTRVKIEEYPGYVFITLRAVRFCDTTDDPYDLETVNLYFFIGANYLVTVHAEESPTLDSVEDLVARSPDILARGTARLAHLIMDHAIDAYFPILDQIDEFIDGLESRVFVSFDQGALHDIFALKRMVLQLRRYLAPQREIFNVLTNRPSNLFSPETQIYFRDIYDHMLRITESLETYRELLSSTLDSYLTQVSNRLGSITKGLSVVATLSVPFVVVSGMWGMNFEKIPLASVPYGFWLMVALQSIAGLGLVALLRWRKLF